MKVEFPKDDGNKCKVGYLLTTDQKKGLSLEDTTGASQLGQGETSVFELVDHELGQAVQIFRILQMRRRNPEVLASTQLCS
jgi:hypothetical protein